mmetsp:Transcript_23265/g.64526  ORF Transcript_23265/g.64526 Transcript_23265/m.64526 type:complete len:90 (-) Transcript_23265:210-479(-)
MTYYCTAWIYYAVFMDTYARYSIVRVFAQIIRCSLKDSIMRAKPREKDRQRREGADRRNETKEIEWHGNRVIMDFFVSFQTTKLDSQID